MRKNLNQETLEEFAAAIRAWRGDGKDKKMTKVYTEDRKRMRKVLSLMRKAKYEEAWRSFRSMDTILREAVPEKAYCLLLKYED